MKRLRNIALLFGMFIIFVIVATNSAWGAADMIALEPTNQVGTGMPGWLVPDKPVPQHQPGRPSRAGNYSAQVTRLNAQGVEEVVQLTGLDAMLADGVISDPLQGNYHLASKDDIAYGYYDSSDFSINLETYENIEVTFVEDSEISIQPIDSSERQSLDITAGDLNGDGVDEQIAAWVDVKTGHIMLAIGEIPSTNGRPSSDPAAAANDDNIDLVVRGYDQTLWHIHYNGTTSTWGTWNNDSGGLMLSGPAIASRDSAAFDVFAVGTDNQIHQNNWNGSGWSGWTKTMTDTEMTAIPAWIGPPPELPAPAVAANGTDEYIFRIAPDNTLHWNHFNGTTWEEWESLGGMLASGPGALFVDGRVQVFAVGVDGALWYRIYDGSWDVWQQVALDGMGPAVSLASAPTPVQLTNGDVRVYGRGSDGALWQVTYDGTWGTWSKGGGDLASRPAVAVGGSSLDIFALTTDGSIGDSSDGITWGDFSKPWLPACCLEMPIDTGVRAYTTTLTNPVDQINLLDIETGHFLGDGRQQIALAYTWKDPAQAGRTGIGLQLFDINDGFRILYPLGKIIDSDYEEDYYPKIAVGEFDGDAPQEIALAYGTRRGGVRVYNGASLNGLMLAFLKTGTYHLYAGSYVYGEDVNSEISSIQIAPGWGVCVYDDDPGQTEKYCFDIDYEEVQSPDLSELYYYGTDDDLYNSISLIEVTQVATTTLPVDVTDGYVYQRNAHVALEIFDFNPQEHTLASQAIDYYEMKFTGTDPNFSYPAPERTLGIAAGDFDGTGDDEIALIWDKVCLMDSTDICQNYRAYFHILDVTMWDISDHGYNDTDDDGVGEVEILKISLDRSKVPHYPYSAEINLTVGDFDGDGKDEIARTWPRGFWENHWSHMYRNLDVLDWDENDKWKAPYIYEDFLGATSYNHEDALVAGDLNLDLQDEIVYLYAASADDPDIIYTLAFTPTLSDPLLSEALSIPNDDHHVPVLTAGDFNGEGLRLGPPTYRMQERVDSVLARLNMPPKHWDMIKNADGTYTTIQILTEECWTSPNDPKCTHTLHGTIEGYESSTSIETQRDWAVAAGSEWKFSNFALLEGSLESSYGQNFGKTETAINSTTFTADTTAAYDDAIVYYSTPYKIWEYPVFSDNTTEPGRYITVIFPDVTKSSGANAKAGGVCQEGWYSPGHQPFNVWSYDPIGDVEFPDYDDVNLIYERYFEGAESEFQVYFVDISGVESSSSQFHGISGEHGVGFEVSGSVGVTVNVGAFGIGGQVTVTKNFENRFKSYMKADYNWKEHVTDKMQASDATYFGAYLASMAQADVFAIHPLAYWSMGGPLVIDFQTAPSSGETWSDNYVYPDPAFILPWYGYPAEDPEDLPFPDPNNQGAPPCGLEKQHFSHDVVINPPLSSVGETVVISATVRNFSNVRIDQPVTVRFYQGLPGGSNTLGDCPIAPFNRGDGPQTCAISWTVDGAGEQKIYAVIDPNHQIIEMHDEDHIINNNMGYGLLQIGAASYVDMGAGEPYELIRYDQSDTLSVALYVPSANLDATARLDIHDVPGDTVTSIGNPFEIVATQGEASRGWGEPVEDFSLVSMGEPPAVIAVAYADADIVSADESLLQLYRLESSGWVEATSTCSEYDPESEYDLIRFPEANRLAVPICQTGTFVLSDQQPEQENKIYLPLVIR